MKLKLTLALSFSFLLLSCGSDDEDNVYDEYHDLVCKVASIDENMSPSEAMELNKEFADFYENKESQMTDDKKKAKDSDVRSCL